jgi:hypothetical protein
MTDEAQGTGPDPIPSDYKGAIPIDTSPNGMLPDDPEFDLSQDPMDVYPDMAGDDSAE